MNVGDGMRSLHRFLRVIAGIASIVSVLERSFSLMLRTASQFATSWRCSSSLSEWLREWFSPGESSWPVDC